MSNTSFYNVSGWKNKLHFTDATDNAIFVFVAENESLVTETDDSGRCAYDYNFIWAAKQCRMRHLNRTRRNISVQPLQQLARQILAVVNAAIVRHELVERHFLLQLRPKSDGSTIGIKIGFESRF